MPCHFTAVPVQVVIHDTESINTTQYIFIGLEGGFCSIALVVFVILVTAKINQQVSSDELG